MEPSLDQPTVLTRGRCASVTVSLSSGRTSTRSPLALHHEIQSPAGGHCGREPPGGGPAAGAVTVPAGSLPARAFTSLLPPAGLLRAAIQFPSGDQVGKVAFATSTTGGPPATAAT